MNCLLFFACSLAAVIVTAQSASDCWDLMTKDGITTSGPYTIYPIAGPGPSVQVWCDMETDGGGWTVLQRRYDGSLDFADRTMSEYEQGFGDATGEYWLGLDWMHTLTSQEEEIQFRADLCSFAGEAGYAVYDVFYIAGQSDSYRLSPGTYRSGGSLGDQLRYLSQMPFQATGFCAEHYRGGWWYSNCGNVHLNGDAYNGNEDEGIVWRNFGSATSSYPSLRSSEMKIRPADVIGGDPSPVYTCPT